MPHKKGGCGCKDKKTTRKKTKVKRKTRKKDTSKKMTEKKYDNHVKSEKKKKESVMVEKPAPHHRFKKGEISRNYRLRAT